MPLAAGTRLGPYEILAPLGAGGMGEVYRARDTRLGRDVAIKVLPAHLGTHPEVRARFEREARTISSLNHPHICVLHDVGREGEIDYLVMEKVEGETLAARLARGALPAGEVVELGVQIADALDRAHRAGVIHRDLKPGNVMLTRSGAKLMDFGLARATGMDAPGGMTHSPTMAAPLTAEGTIIGTFQYMAPEQLDGKEADERSDLWALGCVLYEMATGKRAFEGATQASLISAIMRDQPRAMSEISPVTPVALGHLVDALLAKDPDERVQTAHDVKLQLRWLAESSRTPSTAHAPVATRSRWGGKPAIAWGIAGLSLAVALAVAVTSWLMLRSSGHNAPRVRLLVPGPPGNRLVIGASTFAISPDGRSLVFAAIDSAGTTRLWLRPLEALTARALPGTHHAIAAFWSPDSRRLGFFAEGKLKTIRLEDGAIQTLCDAPDPRGGSWGRQGVVLFAPTAAGPLLTVPEEGGAVTEVARPDSALGETALRFPDFLPDGKHFVFIALPHRPGGYPVHVGSTASSERKPVMQADAAPVYAAPGWLVTLQNDRLVAQRFDAGSRKVVGKPVPIGDAPLLRGPDGTRAVSVSRNGIMAYAAGNESNSEVVTMDRSGRIERRFSLPTARWEEVSLSPDGARALLRRRRTLSEFEFWVMDVASGQARRIGSQTFGSMAIWSRDGKRIAYNDMKRGRADLYVHSLDTGARELLYRSDVQFNNPYSWSADDRTIVLESARRETGWDVWALPLDGDRQPTPLVQSEFNEAGGWLSRDGRWLAYYTDEAGGNRLYVQSYPSGGTRTLVPGSASQGGISSGCWWSRDGRELLFDMGDGSLRAAAVEAGETFSSGRARVLFEFGDNLISKCPTPDHKQFLAIVRSGETPVSAIVADLQWPTALRRR